MMPRAPPPAKCRRAPGTLTRGERGFRRWRPQHSSGLQETKHWARLELMSGPWTRIRVVQVHLVTRVDLVALGSRVGVSFWPRCARVASCLDDVAEQRVWGEGVRAP